MYTKNLFVPAVCSEEKPMKDDKLSTLKQFFDLLTGSKCFSIAYDYLKKNGWDFKKNVLKILIHFKVMPSKTMTHF